MLDVKPQADAARDDLAAAEDALKAEDLPTAEAHIARPPAPTSTAASSRVNGFGGDVWRWVPVAGGAVKDVRHLVDALDQATSIAEIGADLYPDVMESDSLVQGGTVDLDQLERILTGVNRAGPAPERRRRRPGRGEGRHAVRRQLRARRAGLRDAHGSTRSRRRTTTPHPSSTRSRTSSAAKANGPTSWR